jgi:preprotein translocase subunit SecG
MNPNLAPDLKEEFMTSTLLIIQIVLALAITICVLLQKSSSIGLGAYSGSNETMFGAKGPMGFLAKLTFVLGLLFVVNTLALGYFYTSEKNRSIVDTIESAVPASPEAAKSPAIPVAPLAPGSDKPSIPAPPAVDTPKNAETPKPATH